jgi:hypothetical protein
MSAADGAEPEPADASEQADSQIVVTDFALLAGTILIGAFLVLVLFRRHRGSQPAQLDTETIRAKRIRRYASPAPRKPTPTPADERVAEPFTAMVYDEPSSTTQIHYGGYGSVMIHSFEWSQAARNGDVASLRALLANGQRVNEQNIAGITALHSAAQGDHVDAVELLLAHGADATLRTYPEEALPNMTPRELSQHQQVSVIDYAGNALKMSKPAGQRVVAMLRMAESAREAARQMEASAMERSMAATDPSSHNQQDALLNALQREEAQGQTTMMRDWPLGEGDNGPWQEASGLPRGYVKRDRRLFYVGGIPRSLAEKWGVGAGELGYESEPHTAETKEWQEAELARVIASMGGRP